MHGMSCRDHMNHRSEYVQGLMLIMLHALAGCHQAEEVEDAVMAHLKRLKEGPVKARTVKKFKKKLMSMKKIRQQKWHVLLVSGATPNCTAGAVSSAGPLHFGLLLHHGRCMFYSFATCVLAAHMIAGTHALHVCLLPHAGSQQALVHCTCTQC